MDIVDIILSRALTPEGQIENYAATAQKAVTKASAAVQTATQAAQAANDALEQLNGITEDITTAAHNQIDKLAIQLTGTSNSQAIEKALKITYPSENQETLNNIVKYYKSTGNNQDGTMTQKAITEALRNAGGGISNLGYENAGHIVIIDNSGNITSSTNITEQDLARLLDKESSHYLNSILGLQIDYDNYTYQRTDGAISLHAGTDFDHYTMYGGRTRCLVNDSGTIIAFYGDENYSTLRNSKQYQEMVYQPKFYYSRLPIVQNLEYGKIIKSEVIRISDTSLDGFSVHPLFINDLGEQVDYVLLSAYEGSIQSNTSNSYTDETISNFGNQKLASVHDAKPISGLNNELSAQTAERLANNRGSQWHITNMRFESAMQMLELVQFGTLNMQEAFESGISQIESSVTYNNSAITGSTTGNDITHALQTTFTVNEEQVTYSTAGHRAINYRGIENPWGDMWRFVGDVNIYGDGTKQGGEVFVCKNYNYDNVNNTNYDSVGFYLPNNNGWISGFGYGNSDYDWVFLPVECAASANSLVPVGDSTWITPNLNSAHVMVCGGSWAFSSSNGPFYYGCDRGPLERTSRMNARLMYLPHLSDNNYQANIDAWNQYLLT